MSKRAIADLLVLGYTNIWLETGVLSLAILHEQLLEFEGGTDTHSEHYRYKTLIRYFEAKELISDTELNNFLTVVGIETDREVAGTALARLLAKDCLTTTQFNITVTRLSDYGEWTMKIIRRYSLIRQLKSSQLTDENFQKFLIDGDKAVHNLLLDLVPQDKTKLSRLVEQGANSEIRSRANQLLKKKNYR